MACKPPEPSELERSLTSAQIMRLVRQVAHRARHVANGRVHREDCLSEAHDAVIKALRMCPVASEPSQGGLVMEDAISSVLGYARVAVTNAINDVIYRGKKFVNLDDDNWREVDESNYADGDSRAYLDGDEAAYAAENFSVEELLDLKVGYQRVAKITKTPERRVRLLAKRKRNDARTKTQLATEHERRRRPPVPGLA